MKKLLVGSVLFAAVAAYAYDFTPIDWSAQSGTVTLSSGKCYLATEADMQYVNALTLKVSGTLVFSNATTTAKFSASSASGTIVKMGESRQAFNGQIWQFSGTFRIEEGTAVYQNAYSFGDTSNNGNVYVCEGATAELASGTYCFCNRAFHISGTGYQGQGALLITKAKSTIQKLYLDGDATVVSEVESDFVVNYPTASGRFAKVDPAILELNGHTLTLGGPSTRIGLANCKVTDSSGTGGIVYAAADSGVRTVRYTGTKLSLAVPISFLGDAKIQFYNSCAPIDAPVLAGGSLTFDYASADRASAAGHATDCNNWRGDIAFTKPGSVLGFVPSQPYHQITLSGSVTGDASLRIGSSGTPAKGVVYLAGHNAYTGTSTVYGETDLTVLTEYDDSIADRQKLTVSGGVVVPHVKDGDGSYNVLPSDYLDLLSAQLDGTSGAQAPICTTDLTEGDYVLSGSDIATKLSGAADLTWTAFGEGAGRVTVEGPFAESPLKLNIPSGTVRLAGEDPILLGETVVTGAGTDMGGVLVLDGAKVVRTTGSTVSIGSTSTSVTAPLGRMILSNSTFCSQEPYSGSYKYSTIYQDALYVGRNATGVLEIEGDSIVSNKLVVGGGKTYSTGDGVGAVYQRGGLVATYAGDPSYMSSSIGNAGHGSYVISGGTFRPAGEFNLAAYCYGIFEQLGGAVAFPRTANFQSGNGGIAHWAVLGGTTSFLNKGGNPCLCMGTGGTMVITVQGENASFSTVDAEYGMFYCGSKKNNQYMRFNLNDGGMIETGGFFCYQESYPNEIPLLISFNGGILKAYNYTNIFTPTAGKQAPKVVVYEKGAQIDTSRRSAGVSNGICPFEAMKEGGLLSLEMPADGISTKFYAVPRVVISGGEGTGANALALVDSRTFAVTNVLVTCHGWGYTSKPKVTLQYAGTVKYTFPDDSVIIGDNTIGGFTKLGANTFTLTCTNEFKQWTRVLGGTLKAGCDKAIPSGTALTLSNGATLDLNNISDATFAGVDGTGGTVANGTVKIVGEWKVSAKKFIDRETTDVAGTVDLTDCTGIAITDAEALDESAKELRPLVLFKATTVIGLNGVTITDVPNGWKVTKVANGFRMAAEKGMLLLVR